MWERRLASLAIAVAVVQASPVLAQKRSAAPPPHRAPAAPVHVPSPTLRPTPTISIPHQVRSTAVPRNVSGTRPTSTISFPHQVRPTPVPQNISAGGHTPLFGIRRPGVQLTPIHHEYARARAVHREIARRIAITGGVLVLPVVAYYGVPVILEVPEIGSVLVSEESYAKLYDQLSSPDPQQVDLGMAALRTIKANETIEQAQSGPVNMVPADAEPLESSARDLSEPVSFSSPTKRRPRPRSLY
jgi:hypothetical protein